MHTQTINQLNRLARDNHIAYSFDRLIAAVGDYKGHDHKGKTDIYCKIDGEWTFKQTIFASDGCEYDYFGESVTMSEDGRYIIVGAPFHSENRGAVYIFRLENGEYVKDQKLMARYGLKDGYFGRIVNCSFGIDCYIYVEGSSDETPLKSYSFEYKHGEFVERNIDNYPMSVCAEHLKDLVESQNKLIDNLNKRIEKLEQVKT